MWRTDGTHQRARPRLSAHIAVPEQVRLTFVIQVGFGASVAAEGGDIVLQALDTLNGSITLSPGTAFSATTEDSATGGNVYIVIGPVPVTAPGPAPPVQGSIPPFVNVTVRNNGHVRFGNEGITSAAPANAILADGRSVVFNTGNLPATAIALLGGVSISAQFFDPNPPPPPSPQPEPAAPSPPSLPTAPPVPPAPLPPSPSPTIQPTDSTPVQAPSLNLPNFNQVNQPAESPLAARPPSLSAPSMTAPTESMLPSPTTLTDADIDRAFNQPPGTNSFSQFAPYLGAADDFDSFSDPGGHIRASAPFEIAYNCVARPIAGSDTAKAQYALAMLKYAEDKPVLAKKQRDGGVKHHMVR